MKRSASSRVTRLTAHASSFHSSVTLFEAEPEDASGPSTPRRSKRVKLEDSSSSALPDMEDIVTIQKDTSSQSSIKQAKAPSSPRKPKPIPQTLKTPHPPPPRWRETYDAIKEMRSHIVAPVDTMGCDQAQLKETDPKVSADFAVKRYSHNEIA
jgi:endonuclease III